MEDNKKAKKNKTKEIDYKIESDNQKLDTNIIQEEDYSNAMLWGCILGFVLFLIILLFVVIFVR